MKEFNHGGCTWIRCIRSNVAARNPIRIGHRIGVLVRVAGWDRCQRAPGIVSVTGVEKSTHSVGENPVLAPVRCGGGFGSCDYSVGHSNPIVLNCFIPEKPG